MSWKPSDLPIQQAARSIIAHYEGEGWKWPEGKWEERVDEVAHLLAAAPRLLSVVARLLIWSERCETCDHRTPISETLIDDAAIAFAEAQSHTPTATEDKTCANTKTPITPNGA